MNETKKPTDANSTSDETRPGYSPYKLGAGVGTVMVLASLFLFLAFISLWVGRQLLDSQQWTETSTQVIERPAVRNALANYLVDQLFESVDVEQELKAQLPDDWDVLASPATSALRSLTLSGAKSALDLPVVQRAWQDANFLTHEQLISILEGGNENVSTEGGVVTINARSILEDVANKVGLSGELVNKIPENAGTFVVYRSDDLATIQSVYTTVKNLRYVFAGLALLLYILAIWLSAGRRRRAVIWMGASFVTVGLLVLISQSLARDAIVDSLAQTSSVEPAVADIYEIATELLRQMATSLAFTGVLVLLATLLSGPYRWAVSTREFLAPYLRDHLPLSAACATLLFLILLWLAPVNGFQTTVGLTINLGLAIAGFIALVSITRSEFPDAEAADFGEAGAWISKQWNTAQDFVKQKTNDIDMPKFSGGPDKTDAVTIEMKPDEVPQPSGDKIAQLERLAKLHESKALSDEEFAAAKRDLLS